MVRKRKIKISRLPDSDEYAAYRPSSPKNKTIDFSTGYHITTKKEKQKIQAESSQHPSPSDSNPSSKGQTSNEERRDETTHAESELPNASDDEMKVKVFRLDSNTYDEIKKFLEKRYESALPEAVIYGEQEIGSSNEIHPASQGEASSKIAYRKNHRQNRVEECQGQLDQKHEEKPVDSQDFRGKSLSQDSSVPVSPTDRLHLLEKRVQKLEEDACNKKELFFHTQEECKSIIKDIIRLKKERAALKKEYKPLTTKMKKLESKIEEQEQRREELALQFKKMSDEYTVKIIEIVHKTDQSENFHEYIAKEYEIKKSILEYLKDEIEKRQMQKGYIKSRLYQISKSQENIEKIKEHQIQQKKFLDNEKWIEQLKKTESELKEENIHSKELKEALEKSIENYLETGINDINVNKLPTHMRSDALPAKLSLARKYMNKQFGEFKLREKIEEEIIKIAESEITQIKNQVNYLKNSNKYLNEINSYDKIIDKKTIFTDENNTNKNNIDLLSKIDNDKLSYLKDRLEIIDHYNGSISEKIKNNIKDFESRYEKLQNSMCHFEELKETHRIAEHHISQYHFDHALYLEERQRIIKQYGLTNQPLKEEIPIQNYELSQKEYIEVLMAKIEELNKTCKTQDHKIKTQKNLIYTTIPSKMEEYLNNQLTPSKSDLLKSLTKDPISVIEVKNYLEELNNKKIKILKDLKRDAQEFLNNQDKIAMCKWEILKTSKNIRDCVLREIEDYQLEKSKLEKEIDVKLKIIESQFKTDLRHMQHIHNEKKSEIERLRSELEDLEKKMQPEAQQRKLQGQFNMQVNKIENQVNIIDKKLEIDFNSIEDTKNEFDDYNQKREKLTKQIKDHQNKLKKKKKKLEIADAEWLKARIVAEEAHSSLESSIIERMRNSMERRNVRKTSREIGPIAQGLQGDTKNRTSGYLGEVAHLENDYGIINAYNEGIKTQHEELEKLNQNLINLYNRQKMLKRCAMQNRIKIGSFYDNKHKLDNKYLNQLKILNNKKEEYTAIKQVFNKLDEEYHDCLQTCEAVGNVIAILNSEISAEKEGQQKLTSPADEINTKLEQLNALDSQSHTLRQQNAVSAQEVKGLLEKELAAAEQKKMELEEKVEKSRKDLEDKKKQLKFAGSEWIETGKNLSKAKRRIANTLAEKYELRRHLAKVKNDIELIESNKFYNKIESNKIIKNIEKLFEKDNPTVSGNGKEENNKPSKLKSILNKSLESQEDQGRQVKQIRFVDAEINTSQTALEKLKDPLQAREEVEKAHLDLTLHFHEQSSSKLASGDNLTVWQDAEVDRQIKILDEQIIQTNDKDTKLMLEAKKGAMRDRAWRAPLPKRPWGGAAEEEQE